MKLNHNFAENWIRQLKTHWLNKEIDKVIELFKYTTFYLESPFMEPYTTIQEIENDWQHIQDINIQKIEIKILAVDQLTLIAEWTLLQENKEYTGIYEIKFNENLECIYFKSWEMTKDE